MAAKTADPVKRLGLLEPWCLETGTPGSEGPGYANMTRLFDRWRGIATPYDKAAHSYEAAVALAPLLMWA